MPNCCFALHACLSSAMALLSSRSAPAVAGKHGVTPAHLAPLLCPRSCQLYSTRGQLLVTSAKTLKRSPSKAEKKEEYDVYVKDLQPLKEGEKKHVVSIFVADEAGLINRVAGVFARRGANIESLAVGLTVDQALFTVVVNGRPSTVTNLVKQLSKLVKVRYVEDISPAKRVERELMLMKISATAGATRTEVLQLAEIFRARVVDVSENFMTLCVSGDPGKVLAMEKVMAKFGMVEIARTGRICLKRGAVLLDSGTSAADTIPQHSGPDVVDGQEDSVDGDVYAKDGAQDEGIWQVTNVLDPTYGELPSEVEAHTLSLLVQDTPGVLNLVTGVFARRGYNVQSLAVGNCEKEGLSRITMVVPGTQTGITNVIKQVLKLVAVQKVTDLTFQPFTSRELMLVKVGCMPNRRGELRDVCEIFRGSIIDVSPTTLTIELQGKADKMKAFTEVLEPYGILEVARTGAIALPRESRVDMKLLEGTTMGRVW